VPLGPVVAPVNEVLAGASAAAASLLTGAAPGSTAPPRTPAPLPPPADPAVPAPAAPPAPGGPASTARSSGGGGGSDAGSAEGAPAPPAPGATDAPSRTPTEAVADAVGAAARSFTALYVLAAAVVLFLVLQDRLDRGEAKLAHAPLDDEALEFR
ncbi:MAG TPA: hypothetical protein VF152_13605, partial [Acidimicrobiia bacterium]